jgi:hypothetical protein
VAYIQCCGYVGAYLRRIAGALVLFHSKKSGRRQGMTKKQNTIVFILLGTLANVIISMAIITGLLVVSMLTLKERSVYALPFLVIGGIILGMFVYKKLTTLVVTKFNLEDKLDPLFMRSRRRK